MIYKYVSNLFEASLSCIYYAVLKIYSLNIVKFKECKQHEKYFECISNLFEASFTVLKIHSSNIEKFKTSIQVGMTC